MGADRPPADAPEGQRPAKYDRRAIVNGILYVARTGRAWRSLPMDLPSYRVCFRYFRRGSGTVLGHRSTPPCGSRSGGPPASDHPALLNGDPLHLGVQPAGKVAITATAVKIGRPVTYGLSVNEPLLTYQPHAESHYRWPGDEYAAEVKNNRQALRPMRVLYGPPRRLTSVRWHARRYESGWWRTGCREVW